MKKRNVRYLIITFMVVVMLCGLNGCSSMNSNVDNEQTAGEVENKQTVEQEVHGDVRASW